MKLIVDISHEQTCFVYLNSKYCTNAQENQCIQVQTKDRNIYLWAIYRSTVPEGCIRIHPLHCSLVGLAFGQHVHANAALDIRKLEKVNIKADSNDDQIILESNQTQLQRVILTQLRLVVANQKAVVWLSPSVPIVFTPQETGILVNHTQIFVQIIIEPVPANTLVNPKLETNKTNSFNAMKGLKHPLNSLPKRMVLRALTIAGDGKKDLIHPYTVFIHEDLIDEEFRLTHPTLALMKCIPATINDDKDAEITWRHELCIEVCPVNSVVYRSLCREVYSEYIPTVIISKSLNKVIEVPNGTMVMLTFIDSKSVRNPNHIEIMTYAIEKNKESEHDLINKFKALVTENTNSGKLFLINHDMIKENKHIVHGRVKFRLFPDGLAYTTLTQESFRFCTISVKFFDTYEIEGLSTKPIVKLDYDYKSYCRTIKHLELLMERVMSHVYFEINREAHFKQRSDLKSNVLIVGQHGTGKSTICNLVQKEISVYTHILRCRPLKGRRDIHLELSKALKRCYERKPALLIMDDLDDLVPASTEGMSPQDAFVLNALAVQVKSALTRMPGVSVLLTARSVNSLHPVFRMFTAQPMFTAQFNIPDLTQEDRVQLFQHKVNHSIRERFEVDVDDVIRLAMETNGCNITQLLHAFEQKVFAALRKKAKNPSGPKPRLVEDVTKDVEKAKAFDVWGPIGGMEDVKQKLNECIFWPILYPALFPSQSCGILLYGPPGTGKSLIGSCLARLTNFNMITVKGPELLSKYIGQSEAAVREVFDKQDMKHPCILFFDEFDSLAPRRGHDSTGVTDRVVNQLLARLDGAEGGARGPVVVATSRPDLVDPALLRAGRISTHIYTELPTLDGRYEVLRTLSKDFNISPSVDLRVVAMGTEGFSPADLKALLVNAQLNRLDSEMVGLRMRDEEEPTLGAVVIDSADIDYAMSETKPSLSPSQRKFYDIVYRRFRGEDPQEVDQNSRFVDQRSQRVTLA